MFNKLKQFKDLRNQAKKLQNALKEEKIEVEKNGIKIVMDGAQEIVSLDINPAFFAEGKKNELEVKLKETVNAAAEKAKKVMAQKIQSMGGFENFGLGGK